MDNLGLIGKRKSEHWERARDRYHHLDHGASSGASTSSSRQHTRPQEMKWVKGTTQVHEMPDDSAPQKDDDGDVEVVSEVVGMEDGETRKDAVNDDTVHNVCDGDMDHDDKKNGGGDVKRVESSSGEGSSKNGVGVEIKATGEIAEEVPSVSGDGSKTIPSSSNNVTISNDVTENQNNAEPESTSENAHLQNQVDGSNARQTRLESINSKPDLQDPSRTGNSLSSKDEQNSIEVPAEREAAKKPIRFVIPPRMNSKGDLGKTPLTASRSVSDSNGEGPSTRRTRQSSRRGKEKKDNIDMFDDG